MKLKFTRDELWRMKNGLLLQDRGIRECLASGIAGGWTAKQLNENLINDAATIRKIQVELGEVAP